MRNVYRSIVHNVPTKMYVTKYLYIYNGRQEISLGPSGPRVTLRRGRFCTRAEQWFDAEKCKKRKTAGRKLYNCSITPCPPGRVATYGTLVYADGLSAGREISVRARPYLIHNNTSGGAPSEDRSPPLTRRTGRARAPPAGRFLGRVESARYRAS